MINKDISLLKIKRAMRLVKLCKKIDKEISDENASSEIDYPDDKEYYLDLENDGNH